MPIGGEPCESGLLVELFEREVDNIFGFLLSRCGSRPVAEDLTSETFAAASRTFSAGRGNEVTGAWLQTVASRRLIDHWRREASRRRVVERLRAAPVRPTAGPCDEDDRVEVALDSLPSRQRAALVLRYMDGFSTSEVADALDVGYKAAESILSRARRSFEHAYREGIADDG